MKIVTPSVEIMRTGLETEPILPEQFIEKVGRTCYKSEDKITADSAAKFVGNLIKRGHEAMIEHWNLIFKTDCEYYITITEDYQTILQNADVNKKLKERLRPHLRFTHKSFSEDEARYVISGNMRAWRDFAKACVVCFGYLPVYMHGIIRDYPIFFPEYQDSVRQQHNHNDILKPIAVKDLHDTEKCIHQTVTVKFICDRGVSHEMVRHRVASFAQESTRYCNYGQDKFGNEITVVRPSWCAEDTTAYTLWKKGCWQAEHSYFDLIDEGCTPQEARSVLPNSLKTEIIVTMNRDDWDHFFTLRCPANAHPDMREVANMAACLFDREVHLIKDDLVENESN